MCFMEKDKKFLAVAFSARKMAGLENRPGRYTFVCPNCGMLCVGNWIDIGGELHGGTECRTCGILLRF